MISKKEVHKLTQDMRVLGLDILQFTWQVIRRVILPNRSRRGNLLSSLLTFIIGFLERIMAFEGRVLQRPVIFKHKYVKQGLVIAVGFLFLLSSIEWTVAPSVNATTNRSSEIVACAPVVTAPTTNRRLKLDIPVFTSTDPFVVVPSYIPTLKLAAPTLRGKRWIRLRVFRI